jgi:hypothetical protein
MLVTAYSNADFWARRWAFLTDQAVGALARRDPAAAEALAASLLAPEFLHDTQILGAAVEAGIDTSHWEERPEKATYSREAHELSPRFDPDTEARRIWASLFEHYKPIAAALAGYLRELPPTWQEDLFTPTPIPPPATSRPRSGRGRRPRRTTCPGRTARPASKPRTSAATTQASSSAWSTSTT